MTFFGLQLRGALAPGNYNILEFELDDIIRELHGLTLTLLSNCLYGSVLT